MYIFLHVIYFMLGFAYISSLPSEYPYLGEKFATLINMLYQS